MVSAHAASGETIYEIPKPHRHHHLICRECGEEQEIDGDVLAEAFGQVRDRYGFTVETDHLVLPGHCAACAAATPQTDALPVTVRIPRG